MIGGADVLSGVHAHLLSMANSNEYLVTLSDNERAWELHSLELIKYVRTEGDKTLFRITEKGKAACRT